MDDDERRQRIHAAYLVAEKIIPQADIGREIGADKKGSQMRQFKANGTLGKKLLTALESWLAAHGYLGEGAAQPTQPPVPPAAQADFAANVAAELRALADIVDNDRLSHEARALRYSAAIRSWNAVLQEYEESLRDPGEAE